MTPDRRSCDTRHSPAGHGGGAEVAGSPVPLDDGTHVWGVG